jgi:archaemetzincin
MRQRQWQIYHGCPVALTLLPCGQVDELELNDLAQALSTGGLTVRITKRRPMPREAFNAQRGQYRADVLLNVAGREPGDRVLAVTNCDLYADNLNFVFGLANSPGRCAVISLFRLRLGAKEENLRQRAVKEAAHELGHTFDLSHCANSRCVMYFSNTLEDTDRKKDDCCASCEAKLRRHSQQARSFQDHVG